MKQQISWQSTQSVNCTECDVSFTFDVWYVVDRKERPDLWDQCKTDRIHLWRCPKGHRGGSVTSLLLHDPISQELFFSPRSGHPNEIAVEFRNLLYRFANQVGERYFKKVQQTLRTFPRNLLPLGMSGVDSNTISALHSMDSTSSPGMHDIPALLRAQICRRALTLFTKEQAPTLWATFSNRLSMALMNAQEGDRESAMEEAILACRDAISVFPRELDPVRWALGMGNLANFWLNRIRGDRKENADRAIASAREALLEVTERSNPQIWATAHQNLGNALLANPGGSLLENRRQAIGSFEAALRVFNSESDPDSWTKINHNLGIAYFELKDGELEENFERAIAAYYQALRTVSREETPIQWALIQMDLGNVYLARLHGDRLDNQEKAIEAYERGSEEVLRVGDMFHYGRFQYDLCNAYFQRKRGDRDLNMEASLKAGLAALPLLTKETAPDDFGRLQNNLGNAYMNRSHGDQDTNVGLAIEAYEAALTVRLREQHPSDWFATADSLSGAFRKWKVGDPQQNRRKGEQLLEEMLSLDPQLIEPKTYVGFLFNLGIYYQDLSSQGSTQYRERAVEALAEAVRRGVTLGLQDESRAAALRLSELRFEMGQWEKALEELLLVSTLGEKTFFSAVTPEGRESVATSNWFLYQQLCQAALALGRNHDALIYAEEGRSRTIRDELKGVSLSLASDKILGPREGALVSRLRSLRVTLRDIDDERKRRELVSEADSILQELDGIWLKLSKTPEGANFVALRRGERIKWEEIVCWLQSQARPSALVEYFSLHNSVVAFVVRPEAVEPKAVAVSTDLTELQSLAASHLVEIATHSAGFTGATSQQLGDLLVAPLMPFLEGIDVLFVAPHGLLNYVPMLTLEYRGKPLLESFDVVQIMSAAHAVRRGAGIEEYYSHRLDKVLVVGNPTSDLRYADIEASSIARRFGVDALIGQKASKPAIMNGLRTASCAHLAGHASFLPDDPFGSGFVAHGGEVVTARDFMTLGSVPSMIVLSACETGMQRIEPSENNEGITWALFYAGVQSLAVTNWQVDDLSTMLLMDRLYSHLSEGLPVATSLRRAQLWLRSVKAHEIAEWLSLERKRPPQDSLIDKADVSSLWRYFVGRGSEMLFHHPFYWASVKLVQ
jgi:CHAT domain-containing protein/tetratricopeptide (TPR) repeat protein